MRTNKQHRGAGMQGLQNIQYIKRFWKSDLTEILDSQYMFMMEI